MDVALKWQIAGMGQQAVSVEIETIQDFRRLTRKIDAVVRDTLRLFPGSKEARVEAVSVVAAGAKKKSRRRAAAEPPADAAAAS